MNTQSLSKLAHLVWLVGALALAPAAAQADISFESVVKSTPYLTIEFRADSALLSENNRAMLHNLIYDAKDMGEIAKINVTARSDKPFPRVKKLADRDRELADLRADNVRKFIREELNTLEVSTFSMAEDTNWVARTFKSADSEVRSVFAKKDAPTPLSSGEFRVLKSEGGPYCAVVTIQYKPE